MTILRRNADYEVNSSKLLFHIRPFHERYKDYMARRDQIFQVHSVSTTSRRSPKRSTIRLRRYFKRRRLTNRYVISSIINNARDKRYYARIEFLDFGECGLLDTGANVSCLGSSLALEDFSRFDQFVPHKSGVKTADGTIQRTIGFLDVDVTFRQETRQLRFLIVPSITQRVILGLDFWRAFNLAPDLFQPAIITEPEIGGDTFFDSIRVAALEESGLSDPDSPIDSQKYPLTNSQRSQLQCVVDLFPDFSKQGLGRTGLIEHEIDVGDAKPIKQRFYPVSPAVENLMFQEIDRMLALGVIEPSSSPWSSPMRLVLKPNKVRLCLDARRLNQVTAKDAYPLPSIEGIFARLPKANIITKLDLKDAYWQVGLSERSKPLTAFTVPGRPLYQFTVMPFGLCNAPQTMCRLVDQIIPPDLRHCVFGYLDDLVVISEDFSSHISILIRIAQEFKRANLTLNLGKCQFCVTQVKYLGYVIGHGGIQTDPEKVASIAKWPVPKTIKQVRGFLGLASWYRRFIENFSSLTFPITETLSTKRRFKWTPEANSAFEEVKKRLTTAPVLANPDFKEKFYLHCDASDYGIGAVLVQFDGDGEERPIAFMSKKLNTSQRNYSVTERECLAAIEAIKRFRCYLELQDFEVITDHSSLKWLMTQPDLTGRLARWVFKLQPYRFTISHRKGKDHVVPDALSRIPCEEISSIALAEPEIDLNSPCFDDQDYMELKSKISENGSKYPDLRIVDKFVYIRTEHYSGDPQQEEGAWKLWIPKNLRQTLLSRFHCPSIAAHGGMNKTVELIRRNFYWPGLLTDVRSFVRDCEVCKVTKPPNMILKPEMGNQAYTTRPFQRLYVDFLGPYPRSKNGHIGLFIVLDHMTKFVWLCPLRKFSSSSVQKFLLEHIFHIYGVPEYLVSDNGSQFRANDFNAFLTSLGVRHVYTALYSPQSNASERVNRSIISAIRSYLKQDHRQWDENISAISCALRNSVHQAIKHSPYFATFGFNMITHGDSYQLLRNVQLLDEPMVQLRREDQLTLIRKELRRNISQAYDTNRRQYNLRSRPISYTVGQAVFRRNFAQSNAARSFNAKLSPLFVKATVQSKVGNNYYILKDVEGTSTGTYHAKDMRP